jgi:hypothetical protein
MLSVGIEREVARHTEDKDGSFVDVVVHNALPCVGLLFIFFLALS